MMQSFDIVNLIEANPITKLSATYNNKFICKIKESFTTMEQQLFVSSLYCYLNYNPNDFVIGLDNIWNWLGFSQKVNAKVLLEKHFVVDKDYKYLLLNIQEQSKQTKRGGHNKETIMLTLKAFKLFCIKAETKKSHEIHEYFIKLEELLHEIVQEESNELKLQLEQTTEQLEQAKDDIVKIENLNKKELNIKVCKEREQFLLREFGSIGSIIYIIKVKSYDNGEYVIKLGESRKGVQMRYNEHKSNYGEILLLDCFVVKKSKDFESFLHNHDLLKFNRVTDLPGHENERELFLIGKGLSYKTLLNTINVNIKTYDEFNETDMNKLRTENNVLQNIINSNGINSTLNDNTIIQDLLNGQKEMLKCIQKLEHSNNELQKSNKEILNKLNSMQTKTTTNFNQPLVTLGPRLQQINPDTLTINKIYESVAECLKETNFVIKRPSIVKAVDENTIYHGYRWNFVDRELDPNIIHNLQPTKITRIQNTGYVAKLNNDKTKILAVYLDRKTTCDYNKYTPTALDNPIKNTTLYHNYYYMFYDTCEDILKQEFNGGNEPILYKNGIGQYNTNNELVGEFICKYDCIKQLKMSGKTLIKALDKDIMYSDHYFRTMPPKLFI